MTQRVSLSQLAQAGVRLRPAEAAAIVSEICRQRSDGRLRGIPSANVIRITDDGRVIAEGPVNADGPSVARAAQLLEDLIPPIDAPPELRAPGGLRLVIARAMGVLDLPPYPSLDVFCAAVERFAIRDLPSTTRQLFEAWIAARGAGSDAGASVALASSAEALVPAPVRLPPVHVDDALTISDIRRARRATGLTLTDVAERSRIPAVLLRELEWGYVRNWPAGRYGRVQLVRYARAAGLDVDVVLNVAEPLLVEASVEREREYEEFRRDEERVVAEALDGEIAADIVVSSAPVPEVDSPADPPAATRHSRRRAVWIAALAIPAMIALVLISAAWYSRRAVTGSGVAASAASSPSVSDASPAARPETRGRRASADVTPRTVSMSPGSRPPVARDRAAGGGSMAARPVSVARPLTPQPSTYSPAFANTGTAVFFTERARENSALLRADTDPDGSVLRITRVVDDRAQNFHARPSPDGTQIAFDSDRDGERAVYVADADGHHVRRVSGDGFAAVPSWAPDARQLVFVKAEPGKPHVWNLWTANLDTLALRRLTSYPFGQPWGGSWFPDGQHLAFSHEDQLVILDLASGNRRVYRTPVPGHLLRTPAVSPDGRRIIFQVQHDGAWMLELRDGSMRRVLDDPSAEEYTWAPDGRRVAFHSRRTGEWGIWVMGARP